MKVKVFLFFFLFPSYFFAQEFLYEPELRSDFTKDKHLQIIEEMYPYIAENQLTYNFSTADIKNDDKTPLFESLKNISEPASADNIDSLKTNLKGDFSDAETEYKIAMQYYDLKEQTEFDIHIEKAYAYCDEGIQKEPDSMKYYMQKVQILNLFRQYDNIDDVYRLMMKNLPEEITSYTMLAMSYMQSGKFDEAEDMIRKGIQQFPDSEIFYFNLVLSGFFQLAASSEDAVNQYFKENPLDEMFGIQTFEEAAGQYKGNFNFVTTFRMTQVFILFFSVLQDAEAVEDIDKIKLSSEAKKQLKALKKYFAKALKSEKKSNAYMIYYTLGVLDILNADFKAAINNFQAAWDERAEYADVSTTSVDDIFGNLTGTQILSGDTTAAVTNLKKRLEILPSVNHYNLLAKTYLEVGNYKSAEQTLSNALNLGYFDINTVRGIALLYLAQDNTEAAEEYVAEIFRAVPDNFETLLIAGVMEAMNGNAKSAHELFSEARKIKPNDSKLDELAALLFVKKN